jgi:uncharacterized protein (TIGR02996 family)
MSDEDALLLGIIENPDADAPRLVYADWLEERGKQERAEFIRVQCELAKLPEGDPRRARLEPRERRLLKKHKKEWSGPLRGLASSWEFHRGSPTTSSSPRSNS